MNYAVDSTITDPVAVVGAYTGITYLVPPSGAAGLWAGQEDKIAVWGGSIWNFLDPSAGTQYQILDGPDAGRIYVRTATVSSTSNIVPNGLLTYDISGYPTWSTGHTGSGTVAWSAGAINLNCPASASHSAFAKVVIDTLPGVTYNLTYVLGGLVFNGTDQFAKIDIREQPANNIIVDPALSSGTVNLSFTAASSLTSIEFNLRNDVGATAVSSVNVASLNVTREPEHMENGDFSSDFTDWTTEFPWQSPTDTGLPGAFAEIDYPGHTPFPALRQTINGLTAGRTYRVAFNVAGNFARGIISLYVDGNLISDIDTGGDHALFFRAGASTALIEFPLTKIGMSTFDVTLYDVSITEAIWSAGPVGHTFMPATGKGLTCGNAMGRAVRVTLLSAPGFTCGVKYLKQTGVVLLPSVPGLTCGSEKGTARPVGPITLPSAAALRCGSAHVNFLSATLPAVGGLSLSMQMFNRTLVRDAVRRIMNLWGHTDCCNSACSNAAVSEALGKLNAAMQRLYATGKDFGFVSTVPLSLPKASALSDRMPLPENVVAVKRVTFRAAANVGESIFAEFPLRPVVNRHEYEAFRVSQGKDVWPLDAAWSGLKPYVIPLTYFAEAEDPGVAGGLPTLGLMTAPKFSGPWGWSLELQVTVRPPAYYCADVEAGTPLSVPHNYAETLLLPLALYYACSSRYFVRPELVDAITKQAQEAREFVGEIQPAPAEATNKGGDR